MLYGQFYHLLIPEDGYNKTKERYVMEKEMKKWECTDCDIEFEAPLKENNFLPDCPRCKIDYRVFEIKGSK